MSITTKEVLLEKYKQIRLEPHYNDEWENSLHWEGIERLLSSIGIVVEELNYPSYLDQDDDDDLIEAADAADEDDMKLIAEQKEIAESAYDPTLMQDTAEFTPYED